MSPEARVHSGLQVTRVDSEDSAFSSSPAKFAHVEEKNSSLNEHFCLLKHRVLTMTLEPNLFLFLSNTHTHTYH